MYGFYFLPVHQKARNYGRMENKFDTQFVPICLPPKSKAYTTFDDQEAIVTGWGLTKGKICLPKFPNEKSCP